MTSLFGEGVRRTSGSNALRYNLIAAKLIAELVKNSLGPRGMDKMFVDILGEVTVTKSGATLLRKIDVEHPAAKAIIDASNSVDNEVSDGTTSVVIFAGALVEKAEELLQMGIAPATIIDGYLEAMETSLEILQSIAHPLANSDRQALERLASTCLKSKILGSIDRQHQDEDAKIARLVIDAVCAVADFGKGKIEPDDIKIEEKTGNISDTELVYGMVIDKTIDSSLMPKAIEKAKILLLDDELDNNRTKTDAEISISAPSQVNAIRKQEQIEILKKVEKIIKCGANVVISRKGISPLALTLLAREGIISIRRVKENDLQWAQKATGGKITDLESMSGESLGFAGRVIEKHVGDDRMVFIEGCQDPKSVTLLLRAGTKTALDECHRSVLDAIGVLKDFIVRPFVVGGGGSAESLISTMIRDRSLYAVGRKQVVMQKFADALEEIPLTLARNAGMNVIDAMVALRARNSDKKWHPGNGNGHNQNWYGIDAFGREIKNMFSLGIIEPCMVKEQVIKTAVEVTCMLMRVDDVMMAKPTMSTHTHADGTTHSHEGGNKTHDHFDRLGKMQRPAHHYH